MLLFKHGKKILFLVLTIAYAKLFCQSKNYIGLEATKTNNYFNIDAPNLFHKKPFATGQIGLIGRRDFSKHFALEAAIVNHRYSGSLTFQKMQFANCTDLIVKSYLVPLRLIFKQNISNENIFLSATAGYTFGFSNFSYVGYCTFYEVGGDSLVIRPVGTSKASKNFSLLQTGIGIEFKLGNEGILSLNTNYYLGLNTLISTPIEYTINTNPIQKATWFSKGAFWDFGISYKHPIIF